MAELSYTIKDNSGNERSLLLQIGQLNEFRETAVYEESDTDQIYTHFFIDVTCVWNPSATASNQQRDALGALLVPGDDPMTSIAYLRQLLLTPRGFLLLTEGDITILSSGRFAIVPPANIAQRFNTDCKNGPKPIDLKCVSMHGTKSIICRYQIETWLQEAGGPLDTYPFDGAMLSNRWTAQHEVDDQFMTTKTVTGVATFRRDFLDQENLVVDDFRNRLRHPIPDNFKRFGITAAVRPDGLTVDYSFVDEERVLNLLPTRGITRCEATAEYENDWSSGGAGVKGITLPIIRSSLSVEIWARRSTTRKQLTNALVDAVANYFPFGLSRFPWYHGRMTVDYHDRHGTVEFGWVLGTGIVGGIAGLAVPTLATLAQIELFNGEKIGTFADTADGPNIAPPASRGTRGQFLEVMVTQALNAPGARPSSPPVSRPAMDVIN